jgi:hypothetical protein
MFAFLRTTDSHSVDEAQRFAQYGELTRENDELKARIAQLEYENADLRHMMDVGSKHSACKSIELDVLRNGIHDLFMYICSSNGYLELDEILAWKASSTFPWASQGDIGSFATEEKKKAFFRKQANDALKKKK